MSGIRSRKLSGAYYTPDPVVGSLVRWAVRDGTDRMLDPSCGDGGFLAGHRNVVGVERNGSEAAVARARAPWATVHEADFFAWCSETTERFDCAAGNPPFIRYQHFKGEVRARAAAACARLGVTFSNLASSWAPFLVAASGLVRPGGRMSFVIPAEIGHAPYAVPLIEHLVAGFSTVHVVAVREKLFPTLSEDCWLLHAEGRGGSTEAIRFTALDRFSHSEAPPRDYVDVPVSEWRDVWDGRLRPYLLGAAERAAYRVATADPGSRRLGDLARVGIGYVSGDNGFFHMRPSEAARLGIPAAYLHPTVRNGRALPRTALGDDAVAAWVRADEPVLLLRLPRTGDLPASVRAHLDSEAGLAAREAYKCRVRAPWHSVPDVQVPDLFLSYMSGLRPNLVRNDAGCTCTNSVHTVRLYPGVTADALSAWDHPLTSLSCELQGHPLGGGMLKVEPREAARVVLPSVAARDAADPDLVGGAVHAMRTWRHAAKARVDASVDDGNR